MGGNRVNTKQSLAILAGVLVAVVVLALYSLDRVKPLTEPLHEGKPLRYWVTASPKYIASDDDLTDYRRAALQDMGKPAVDYLVTCSRHPRKMIEGHTTTFDRILIRLRPYVPKLVVKLTEPPPNRLNFEDLVLALEFIGPPARSAAPELIRLWESNGQPTYSTHNGFPIALSQLGDNSPAVLSALRRHYGAPDRLHRALCAFAVWKLEPADTEAVGLLRQELSSSDYNAFPRYALLDALSRWGGTNVQFFMPEIAQLDRSYRPGHGDRTMEHIMKRIRQTLATSGN